MNVKQTPVSNAVNFLMFMINVSAKLREMFGSEHPDFGVLDIKARYRGLKAGQETLKYFHKNLKRLLLATSLNIWGLSVLFRTLLLKSDPDNLAKVLLLEKLFKRV